MTIRRIRRAFYRRNIGPGFRSTAGLLPPACILGTRTAVLGCAQWSPALPVLAAPLECSVIPDLLENLLFQPSMLIRELLFL